MYISTMQNYARIFVVVCVFLCLTLNYTFPIHRASSDMIPLGVYHNGNHNQCEDFKNVKYNRKYQVKKGVLSLKGDKKVKHSDSENIQINLNTKNNDKNIIKNIDLRQYEQLVIMKKYPYLDIKELEMKYRPSGKSIRHSLSFDSGSSIKDDPSICEQREDLLNVEISSRGLSGFAIPIISTKPNLDSKCNLKNDANAKSKSIHQGKTQDKCKLESLKQKLLNYLDARKLF